MVTYMSENPWKDQTPEAARLDRERRANEIRTPQGMDTGFSLSPEESADLEKMTSPGAQDYVIKTDKESFPVADVVGAQLEDAGADVSSILESGVSENVNRVLREDPQNPGIYVGQLTDVGGKISPDNSFSDYVPPAKPVNPLTSGPATRSPINKEPSMPKPTLKDRFLGALGL